MRRIPLILALALAPPAVASAQSIEVDGDGARIEAGDASIEAGTDGSARVESGAAPARTTTTRTTTSRTSGDRHMSTRVEGTVINQAEGAGAVSEQSFGDDTQVAHGETVVTRNGSTTAGSATRAGGESYVNADLKGRRFAGASLGGVAFTNSDLSDADFSRADLAGADFVNASLNGARLDGANLRGAALDNADLEGATFDGATWIDGHVCAQGSRGRCR